MIQALLTALFTVLEQEESRENEYVMKTITRVCNTAQETILPFVQVIITKITAILAAVSKQPKNPNFNHMLFETLSCLITNICPVLLLLHSLVGVWVCFTHRCFTHRCVVLCCVVCVCCVVLCYAMLCWCRSHRQQWTHSKRLCFLRSNRS